MSNESVLREKARKAITAGRLPNRHPDRTWGGRGEGDGVECPICGAAVERDEIEYEIEFAGDDPHPGSYHVHVRCFAAWESERRKVEGGRPISAQPRRRSASPVAGGGGWSEDDGTFP